MGERQNLELTLSLSGAQAVEVQFQKLAQGIAKFGEAAMAPIAGMASAAGVVDLAKQFIDLNVEVEKAMRITGIAAGQMAGMAQAAQKEGVGIRTLEMGLKSLSEWMVQTGQGNKNLKEAFLEQADFFKQLGDGAERNALAQQRFGRAGLDLIPILSKGSEELSIMFDRGEALAGVTNASIKGAKYLSDAWFDLLSAGKSAAGATLAIVGPAMLWTLDKYTNSLVRTRQAINAFEHFVGISYDVPDVKPAETTVKPQIWTKEDLDIADKAIDLMREHLSITMQQGDMRNKGMDGVKNFNKDLDAIDAEQEMIERKRLNATAALTQKAISRNEFDSIEIGVQKDLLALDLKRQSVAQAYSAIGEKKASLDLAELERQRAAVQSDFTKTEAQKRAEDIQLLQASSARVKALIDAFESLKQDSVSPALKAIYNVGEENAQVQKQGIDFQLSQKQGTANPDSLFQQIEARMVRLKSEWGTLSQSMADVFTKSMTTSMDAVGEGLTKMITTTQRWNLILYQVAETIMTSIVQSIIKMAEEWIMQHVIMAAVGAALRAMGIAQSAAANATIAASAAPAATLTTIASYGSAASAAPGLMAAAMGAAEGMAGFSEGGYTGYGGMDEAAGIVHRGEFVMPADAVSRLGLPRLEAMRSGGASTPSVAGGNTSVHLWGLEDAMNEHIRGNPAVEHQVLKIIRQNAHRVFPRSA